MGKTYTNNLNLTMDDDQEFYDVQVQSDNAASVDAAFDSDPLAGGHDHNGLGAPIPAEGLKAGAATDSKIGDRTLTDTIAAPAVNVGTLSTILSWFANRIKAITGKADWKTAPRTTLENAVKRDGDTMTGELERRDASNTANSISKIVVSNTRAGGTSETTGAGVEFKGYNLAERVKIYMRDLSQNSPSAELIFEVLQSGVMAIAFKIDRFGTAIFNLLVSAPKIESTSTDDATSITIAPLKSAGGLAVAKRAYFGGKVRASGGVNTIETGFTQSVGEWATFFMINESEIYEVYVTYNRFDEPLTSLAKFTVVRGSGGATALATPVTKIGTAVDVRLTGNTVEVSRSGGSGGARQIVAVAVRLF